MQIVARESQSSVAFVLCFGVRVNQQTLILYLCDFISRLKDFPYKPNKDNEDFRSTRRGQPCLTLA